MQRVALPNPDPGARICAGFDGSETGDFTALRAETIDGFQFTPWWNDRLTIWNPADEPNGRMPRHEVDAAVDWLFGTYEVERMYCDPPLWETEVDGWSLRHGEKRVIRWATYRPLQMHSALERFQTDVLTGKVTHDGCPIASEHIRNARMAHRRDGRYLLTKPDAARKIDGAMASVLAHEAACDARASGWTKQTRKATFFRM